VERLKAYQQRLIVFPRKSGKPKKGDSTVSNLFLTLLRNPLHVSFQGVDLTADTTRLTLPLPEAYPAEPPRKITDEEREFNALRTLRMARANKRHEGARKVRAAKVGSLPSLNWPSALMT
jgi:large subunit ribosomal protein L13e